MPGPCGPGNISYLATSATRAPRHKGVAPQRRCATNARRAPQGRYESCATRALTTPARAKARAGRRPCPGPCPSPPKLLVPCQGWRRRRRSSPPRTPGYYKLGLTTHYLLNFQADLLHWNFNTRIQLLMNCTSRHLSYLPENIKQSLLPYYPYLLTQSLPSAHARLTLSTTYCDTSNY